MIRTVIGQGIVRLDAENPGPVIGVICNVHGNELCGRKAVHRLLASKTLKAGSLILIDGNPEAALLYRRFVQADMNRMFTPDQLAENKPGSDLERAKYLAGILPNLAMDLAVDFHSVSSETRHPFTIAFPTSHDLAKLAPTPRIYGWSGIVTGTLCEYLCDHSVPAIVVETGQHEAQSSVQVAERTLHCILSFHGLLENSVDPGEQLEFDVLVNVPLSHKDSFDFTGDYASFDDIAPGELIATDKSGEYRAPGQQGLKILMPADINKVREGVSPGAYYLMRQR